MMYFLLSCILFGACASSTGHPYVIATLAAENPAEVRVFPRKTEKASLPSLLTFSFLPKNVSSSSLTVLDGCFVSPF